MIEPYFDDGHIRIYNGNAMELLPELAGCDAVITDPPYSSGGAMRADRMATSVAKYVQSSTIAYRPEFSGDNRDQRGYFAWSTLLDVVRADRVQAQRPDAGVHGLASTRDDH